jgi:serine/threonine protein kinase
MGPVFHARDTKLDRDVTIKLLPEAFAHDADPLARFTREAKVLAWLSHLHIAAIHGLEESRIRLIVLKKGDEAVAIITSTEVMIGRLRQCCGLAIFDASGCEPGQWPRGGARGASARS